VPLREAQASCATAPSVWLAVCAGTDRRTFRHACAPEFAYALYSNRFKVSTQSSCTCSFRDVAPKQHDAKAVHQGDRRSKTPRNAPSRQRRAFVSAAGAALQVAGRSASAGRLRSCKGQQASDTFTTIGVLLLSCPARRPLSGSQRCLGRKCTTVHECTTCSAAARWNLPGWVAGVQSRSLAPHRRRDPHKPK
jgi:hypothetical protein